MTRTVPRGACGKGVVLNGDDGVQYTYCDGSRWLVPDGARVAAGTALGLTGKARKFGRPYLSFQVVYPTARPVKTPRCPQGLLLASYDNAAGAALGPAPNPRSLPARCGACRR